jgi:CHAD domain-containing protein
MSALTQQVQRHVLRLHIRLLACRERLAAGTDQQALHDLRVAVRQLRNLLRPLPAYTDDALLKLAAAQLGRVSGPLRDLEVLHAFLARHGATAAAQVRQPQLEQGYQALLQGHELSALLSALDDWTQHWRAAVASDELAGMAARVRRRLSKDQQRLAQALSDPEHDWHELRLLVKRLRYGCDAYPEQAARLALDYPLLKQTQSALGKWHDCWQWLERAAHDRDLQPWVVQWQRALARAQQRADKALTALREHLPAVV